jgi:hypothetical protein
MRAWSLSVMRPSVKLVRLFALRAADVVLLVIVGVWAPDDRPVTHTGIRGIRVGKDHHLVVLRERHPVATRDTHGQRAMNGLSAHRSGRLVFLGAHRPSSVTVLPRFSRTISRWTGTTYRNTGSPDRWEETPASP